MDFCETYRRFCQSVVAIVVKEPLERLEPRLPSIIGTGFVVGEGLIATNEHVIQEARKLQQKLGCGDDEWPFRAMLFFPVADQGICQFEIDVLGVLTVNEFVATGGYYGPPKPDIGLMHVNMKGLEPVRLLADHQQVMPGTPVATIGYPMGSLLLKAPGYVHQLHPTLQQGIVSAVLPCPAALPHAYMLNLMSQGGASGSPVFLAESGDVVGILYSAMTEIYHGNAQGIAVPYKVPTNFSYCVPSHLLCKLLELVLADIDQLRKRDANAPNFTDIRAEAINRYGSSEKI